MVTLSLTVREVLALAQLVHDDSDTCVAKVMVSAKIAEAHLFPSGRDRHLLHLMHFGDSCREKLYSHTDP